MQHGNEEVDESESIRDEMDKYWCDMTDQEQERIRWLSEDLYLLAEDNPQPASMSSDERQEWTRRFKSASQAGPDQLLAVLRKPYPSEIPRAAIPYLRARCYEKLGTLEAALPFMQAAEKHDRGYAAWEMQ